MQLAEIVQQVNALKAEIDALRPIDYEQEQRIMQKFRLEWNYHSNAIEGNTLTLGETRAFLLHGITAQGKPFRDYEDIKGHKEAIDYLEQFVKQKEVLTEAHIRELHRVLLIEPYEMPAVTPEGLPTKRRIEIGRYKTASNSVRTSTGAMHYYATPQETPALMGDLMQWYRSELEKPTLHPLIVAATFHLRFVNIHPFDDGNGRMARLLMNLILMQAGYVPVVIQTNSKAEYLLALEKADAGEAEDFIGLIGQNLIYSLALFLRGAKGERIEDLADLDKRIALLQQRLVTEGKTSSTPKDAASQKNLFDQLIRPLFTKLLDKLAQFDLFFEHAGYATKYTIAGQSEPILSGDKTFFGDKTSQLQKLGDVLNATSEIHSIVITYTWQHFLQNPEYNVKLQIQFDLAEYQVSGKFSMNGSTFRAPDMEQPLLIAGYHKTYSTEEIDAMIYSVVQEVYVRVEQMAEAANPST